ncbi:TPA: hypothetical protein U1C79_002025 [Streptococcus suis]|nr:hypothetical protein [Streptococcus suis]HEM3676668.1 hypothetical protein [Streptococcus suis]
MAALSVSVERRLPSESVISILLINGEFAWPAFDEPSSGSMTSTPLVKSMVAALSALSSTWSLAVTLGTLLD